ncbi:uncharacterized protein LOC132740011 [Ruditapes philippinarum]|uniref:uncharacterized protein LOC132740011 n=1 Tax=Ruditapes philippinarum TaxID=129788 RepID=UPI00295B80D5|nr:uncharacterized protein LOC132740011 [Ruditapes philippinarum]
MNRLSRNDYKAYPRMNKTHRGQDSQRKSANRRKVDDKTSQTKRRSKSALPPQGQRPRSMPQNRGQVRQRKRRANGHNSFKAEIRNHSAYELKRYLDENYDSVQHTNIYEREIPKVPASQWNDTNVSKMFYQTANR